MLRSPFFHASLWTAVLMVAFSIPGQLLSPHSILAADKLFHFAAFAILVALWIRAYPGDVWKVVALAAFFAVFVEFYQDIMPINRSFDVADIAADVAGILVGIRPGVVFGANKKSREAEQL